MNLIREIVSLSSLPIELHRYVPVRVYFRVKISKNGRLQGTANSNRFRLGFFKKIFLTISRKATWRARNTRTLHGLTSGLRIMKHL